MQSSLHIRNIQVDDKRLCNGLDFMHKRYQPKTQPTKYRPPENSEMNLNLQIPAFNFFLFFKMLLKTEQMNLTRVFFNVLLRTNAFLLVPRGVVSMQRKG